MTAQYHGYCTGSEQQPCDSCAMAVRMPHKSTISVRFCFPPRSPKNCTFAAQSVRGLRAMPVRRLCNATYDMYTGYGLTIFSNLFNFSRNKIVKAAEPVNSYENLTAASCLRTEKGIRAGYGLRRLIAGQM